MLYGEAGGGDLADVDLAQITGAADGRGFRIDGAAGGDAAAGGDFAGESVAGAGDVDGDGHGEVIVGAPLADSNGRTSSGSAYVVASPIVVSISDASVTEGGLGTSTPAIFDVTLDRAAANPVAVQFATVDV